VSNDLLFQWVANETDLVFGDVTTEEIIAQIVADAIPSMPTITAMLTSNNSLDLIDADGVVASALAQTAEKTSTAIITSQSQASKLDSPLIAHGTEADVLASGLVAAQQDMNRSASATEEWSQQATTTGHAALALHTEANRTRSAVNESAQQTIQIDATAKAQHTETEKVRPILGAKHAHGLPTVTALHVDHHHGRLVSVSIGINWQQAIPPPSGYWQGVLPPGPPIPVPDNGEKAHLLFSKQNGVDLLFGHLTAGEALADREAYIVANTFEMKRASDNEPIECRDFNASIDVDSWSWSWSASIAASQQSLVEPADGDPVEVIVTVNGFVLRLVCERMSRARKFPDTWLSINGRGRSAWLADPYDFARTYDNDAGTLTANQLADEAMKENGVPVGWTVDWGIEDWSVPAGVWHFQGTHIDAVNRIAEAAGAYVQADQSTKTLHILPRYPAMPVDWDELVGDVELPEDICETESIEWVDKADYNAVWVAGGADGRLDKVKKTGSAGDRPAQTVTDDLMTATQATRQRGIRVLADTGRQSMVTLRLPVIDEVGVVMVGDVVDYTQQGVAKRGINRSTSLQYNYPQLWQTIKVETHG